MGINEIDDWSARPVPLDAHKSVVELMDKMEAEIYRQQDTITALDPSDTSKWNAMVVENALQQATITEQSKELAEWRAATSVPDWRELKKKIAAKEQTDE